MSRSLTILLGLAVAVALAGGAAWAVLAIIGASSMRQLASELKAPPADLTMRVTASGCHWRYGYDTPHGPIEVDPAKAPCATQACRLGLDPDKAAVVPVGKVVHLVVTAETPGPHALLVPTLALRIDVEGGQTHESWLKAEREGHFVGTATANCRADPDSIPFGLRAVDARSWAEWLDNDGR